MVSKLVKCEILKRSFPYESQSGGIKMPYFIWKINSKIEYTDQEKEYFTISSDLRFNIKILFNLSKILFFDNFNISSLKNSVDNLNK